MPPPSPIVTNSRSPARKRSRASAALPARREISPRISSAHAWLNDPGSRPARASTPCASAEPRSSVRSASSAKHRADAGPAAGRGALLGVSSRAAELALVECDLAEIGQRRRPPVGALELALHGRELLLQLDGAPEVAGEPRDLAAADEGLGEASGRESFTVGQGRLGPLLRLGQVAVRDQERIEGPEEPPDVVRLTGCERVRHGCAQVRVVRREPRRGGAFACAVQRLRVRLPERDEIGAQPSCEHLDLLELKQVRGELPDRVEHPVAPAGEVEQALLDERLQGVEIGAADLLGSLQRGAPREDCEGAEERLLLVGEQVVRPLHRRPQRLLARVGVATAPEQVEPLREPAQDLTRGKSLRAGGGELDGQRERVEARAQLADLLGRLELRPLAEERHGVGLGERRHGELDLAPHAQQLAAGREHGEVGAGGEERRELAGGGDHVLEVVEQHEQLALADVVGEPVLRAERPGDRLRHQAGIAQRGELDPEDPRVVVGNERAGGLDRQTCLAGAARAGERQEARAAGDAREHLLELALATDEDARRAGQVGVRDRLERRERAVAELEDRDHFLHVSQPVLAQLEEGGCLRLRAARRGERGRRVRDQDLAAVARCRDPSGDVDVVAHVALLGDEGRSRMQPHPHPDRARRKFVRDLRGRRKRGGRRREGDEELVALRVHLDAARDPNAPRTIRRCSASATA